MIGYVGIQEQVDEDFHRALLRASLRGLWNRMCGKSGLERLLAFEEAKDNLAGWSQTCLPGIRPVEVEKIVGSVGRWRDFDGNFLPRNKCMGGRWGRVDRAYHQGVELPAVSLYKIGAAYYVRDGNHRVSVARYHGVAAIDAEVVELRGRVYADASHGSTRAPGPTPRRPLLPAEHGSSWLGGLWQRLRPGIGRPEARPLTQ